MDVNTSYWKTAFLVMVFTGEQSFPEFSTSPLRTHAPVGADVVYPVGNLYLSSVFEDDSQSLAGGLFNVASRVRTGQKTSFNACDE